MRFLLGILGLGFMIYGVASLGTNRLNTGVLAFLCLGILFFVFAFYYQTIIGYLNKRKKFRNTLFVILLIGLLFATICEGLIISGMKDQHPKNIDYIVVLGAGVKNGSPTPALRARLEKALEVHKQYPNVKIYVSGGLDTGEKQTEAKVMADYLMERGISANQIRLETQSTSTEENFAFTKRLIKIDHPKILVISSDFHLYRAKSYAEKAGFEPYSAAAPIPISIVPLTHIREILAVGFMLARDGVQTIF